ncbi:hypothetical protein U1Q18_045179, partial [Sarracenia purpurea var. burkii]
ATAAMGTTVDLTRTPSKTSDATGKDAKKMKKGKSEDMSSWRLDDPGLQRRKRVASYKGRSQPVSSDQQRNATGSARSGRCPRRQRRRSRPPERSTSSGTSAAGMKSQLHHHPPSSLPLSTAGSPLEGPATRPIPTAGKLPSPSRSLSL